MEHAHSSIPALIFEIIPNPSYCCVPISIKMGSMCFPCFSPGFAIFLKFAWYVEFCQLFLAKMACYLFACILTYFQPFSVAVFGELAGTCRKHAAWLFTSWISTRRNALLSRNPHVEFIPCSACDREVLRFLSYVGFLMVSLSVHCQTSNWYLLALISHWTVSSPQMLNVGFGIHVHRSKKVLESLNLTV